MKTCRTRTNNATSIILTALLMLAVIAFTKPSLASGIAGPAAEAPPEFCLFQQCMTQGQLAVAGTVAAVAAAGAATLAYAFGPEAAIAAGGGFLLFGHLLFDAVPVAIAGAATWYYGPQVWTWIGLDTDEPSAAGAP